MLLPLDSHPQIVIHQDYADAGYAGDEADADTGDADDDDDEQGCSSRLSINMLSVCGETQKFKQDPFSDYLGTKFSPHISGQIFLKINYETFSVENFLIPVP